MGDQVIMEKEALATVAILAPVTWKRKVNDHLETALPKPCMYFWVLSNHYDGDDAIFFFCKCFIIWLFDVNICLRIKSGSAKF